MDRIELVTSRLRLRPVTYEDAAATSALMRGQIAANLTTWAPETTVAAAKERIEGSRRSFKNRVGLDLAILDRTSGELFGWLSLFREGNQGHIARIGFWLGCDHQGQGFLIEAAEQAMPLGLDFLGISALEACVYPWNKHCISAMAKLQFDRDGTAELYSPVRQKAETALLFRREFTRFRQARRRTASPCR